MTDQLAALGVLAQMPGAAREEALAAFYESFADDALVIDKWLALQAVQPRRRRARPHPRADAAQGVLRSAIRTACAR